ncbi:sialidase family protein [Victivallis vadensis]|uniref:sialidase family protein n=1 Tax=Victivallis vadensis TaxID=172901 RepID=UPI003D045944
MKIDYQEIETGFRGERCFVHARGAVSPDGREIIITTQPLRLSGCDVFYGLHMLRSTDGGKSWSEIVEQPELRRRACGDGLEIAMSDATPAWHAVSGRFLLTGHSVLYRNDELFPSPRPRCTLYSVFDSAAGRWTVPKTLEMPGDWFNCGAGCTQRVDLDNGEILLPVYFMSREESMEPQKHSFRSAVVRCSFSGEEMRVLEIGRPLEVDVPRGLGEPSLARIGSDFYLTMRNDERGYVAHSRDGLNFDPPVEWRFDDGRELGSYNTQQHWITGGGRLYLVYTRRGAGNDHVFRHRAPLFAAEVDRETLRVIRSTEQIAVPERGARLGNFGCVHLNDRESLVIASEWMQTTPPAPSDWKRCMRYGSRNSIFIARIRFD